MTVSFSDISATRLIKRPLDTAETGNSAKRIKTRTTEGIKVYTSVSRAGDKGPFVIVILQFAMFQQAYIYPLRPASRISTSKIGTRSIPFLLVSYGRSLG